MVSLISFVRCCNIGIDLLHRFLLYAESDLVGSN